MCEDALIKKIWRGIVKISEETGVTVNMISLNVEEYNKLTKDYSCNKIEKLLDQFNLKSIKITKN